MKTNVKNKLKKVLAKSILSAFCLATAITLPASANYTKSADISKGGNLFGPDVIDFSAAADRTYYVNTYKNALIGNRKEGDNLFIPIKDTNNFPESFYAMKSSIEANSKTAPYIHFSEENPPQNTNKMCEAIEVDPDTSILFRWNFDLDKQPVLIYFPENIDKYLLYPGQGQHLYDTAVGAGEIIPVAGWVANANEIASHHEGEGVTSPWEGYFHFVKRGTEFKYSDHNGEHVGTVPCTDRCGFTSPGDSTAWNWICAKCGYQCPDNFYGSMIAVGYLPYLQNSMAFAYKCRNCQGMEQGSYVGHSCQEVSTNMYFIKYEINELDYPGELTILNGTQADDAFYHDYSAQTYDGVEIKNKTTQISNCSLEAKSMVFDHWYLKGHGDITFLAGEPIYKLNEDSTYSLSDKINTILQDKNYKNGSEIVLCAAFKESPATLKINPNGGTYDKKSGTQSITGSVADVVNVLKCKGPAGYTVTFHPMGGTFDSDGSTGAKEVTTTKTFSYYKIENTTYGKLSETESGYTYEFKAPNVTNTITAQYTQPSVSLRYVSKKEYQFCGWYTKLDGSISDSPNYIGRSGEKFTPTNDIHLYAKWADLKLKSTENYEANDGKGAADLTWEQADGINGKLFNIYRATKAVKKTQHGPEEGWSKISQATNGTVGNQPTLRMDYVDDNTFVEIVKGSEIPKAQTQSYKINYSGYYDIVAYGASGGNFAVGRVLYTGGLPGKTTMRVYLKAGDILEVKVGGQDGNGAGNGGNGRSGEGANGGGSTRVVLKRAKNGVDYSYKIMISGGGGGASNGVTGGNGGKQTDLRTDGKATGQSYISSNADSMAGGGAGAVGGLSGITHTHSTVKPANRFYYTDSNGNKILYSTIKDGCYQNKKTFSETTPCKLTPELYANEDGDPCNAAGIPFQDTHDPSFKGYAMIEGPNGDMKMGHFSLGNGEYRTCHKCKETYTGSYYLYYWVRRHTDGCTKGDYERTSAGSVYARQVIVCPNCHKESSGCGWNSSDIVEAGHNITIKKTVYAKNCTGSRKASGGSNFVADGSSKLTSFNTDVDTTNSISLTVANYSSQAGKQPMKDGAKIDDGYVKITPVAVGVDGNSLKGVAAEDKNAPYKIDITTTSVKHNTSTGKTQITWAAPDDKGTNYWFSVESYKPSHDSDGNVEMQPSLVSNVTKNHIVTGVAGYFYTFTGSSDTLPITAETTGVKKVIDTKVTVTTPSAGTTKYLKIAPFDKAGNIGKVIVLPISMSTGTGKNVGRIIFNTNTPEFLLNKDGIDRGDWNNTPDNNAGDYSSNGINFYRGYYCISNISLMGTDGIFDATTDKIVTYGGAFPTPSHPLLKFKGWSTTPNGVSGFVTSSDTKSFKDLTGINSSDAGQEMVLYAVWEDLDNNECSIKREITYGSFDNAYSGNIKVSDNTLYFADDENRKNIWAKEGKVKVTGRSLSFGTYQVHHMISPKLVTKDGIDIAYYPAGEKTYVDNAYCYENFINSYSDRIFTYAGIISPSMNDSYYSDKYEAISLDYRLQGTYQIYGKSVDRNGANKNSETVVLRIDKTCPRINSYKVKQNFLDQYNSDEIESKITLGGNLNTVFNVTASDYNSDDLYPYTAANDASGLYGVYVYVYDMDNQEEHKLYTMSRTGTSSSTLDGSSPIMANYTLSVDLYREFPRSSKLIYTIFAVDNAGNISNPSSNNIFEHTPTSPVNPDPNPDPDTPSTPLPTPGRIIGVIPNFTVKTVYYNDENVAFNVEDGQNYFRVGDVGRVKIWTYGYAEKVQLDFTGDVGTEAKNEIESGRLDAKYNMGLLDAGYVREINYNMGRAVLFNINGSTTELAVDNVPLAVVYDTKAWGSDGVSQRIPPYYKLQIAETKPDGTVIHKRELHSFNVYAKKTKTMRNNTVLEYTTSDASTYILWSSNADDVHYRVTHETNEH